MAIVKARGAAAARGVPVATQALLAKCLEVLVKCYSNYKEKKTRGSIIFFVHFNPSMADLLSYTA